MVGVARCAIPARVVAGGTNTRASLAFGGVAPRHAARTSQRDVPTTLNRYRRSCLRVLGTFRSPVREGRAAKLEGSASRQAEKPSPKPLHRRNGPQRTARRTSSFRLGGGAARQAIKK